MKPLHLPAIRLEVPDRLPQPFRMIDKTVTYILERALQRIDELEHMRQLAHRQLVDQVHLDSPCTVPTIRCVAEYARNAAALLVKPFIIATLPWVEVQRTHVLSVQSLQHC